MFLGEALVPKHKGMATDDWKEELHSLCINILQSQSFHLDNVKGHYYEKYC